MRNPWRIHRKNASTVQSQKNLSENEVDVQNQKPMLNHIPTADGEQKREGRQPKDDTKISDQDGEGITVAIRMKPLSSTEQKQSHVWKVLPKYSSVTQTTSGGKPLPERDRVVGKTFFTFDKIFDEQTSTEEIYDKVVQGIVSSVVSGVNGTVFTYGQTSSGKTYTMQGPSSLDEGSTETDGIIRLAARDIFQSIEKEEDRIFLTRASYIEIYHEEVRDLLSENHQNLQIREDRKRGVFVQSNEETVTTVRELLDVLTRGEKSRTVAATSMNERSSRSHTIFRITVESRTKPVDQSENEENRDPFQVGDGAVLVSTLNLVDLAGSESVRHTGATGERQKEGGMINQSLLTLSRVIVALSSPNKTHINFRDSKLTRLLQTSLSGNARMAVICCATPSRTFIEETRSTLQFAARAKLVKTRAQVNEVLDDRSHIRRLRRELALARQKSVRTDQDEQLKVLEQKASMADLAAREAQARCHRLQISLLNCENFYGRALHPDNFSTNLTKINRDGCRVKRRHSLEPISVIPPIEKSMLNLFETLSPMSLPDSFLIGEPDRQKPLSPTTEVALLHEALYTKAKASTEKNPLNSFKDERDSRRKEIESATSALQESLAEKDAVCQEALAELELVLTDCDAMRVALEDFENEKQKLKQELDLALAEISDHVSEKAKLQESIFSLNRNISLLSDKIGLAKINLEKSLIAEKDSECQEHVSRVELALSDCEIIRVALVNLQIQKTKLKQELEAVLPEIANLKKEKDNLQVSINSCNRHSAELKAEKLALQQELKAALGEISEHVNEKSRLQASINMANSKIISLHEQLDNNATTFEKTLLEKDSERQDALAKLEATLTNCDTIKADKRKLQQELNIALAEILRYNILSEKDRLHTSFDDHHVADKNNEGNSTEKSKIQEKLELLEAEHAHTKSSLISEKDNLMVEKNKVQEKFEKLEVEHTKSMAEKNQLKLDNKKIREKLERLEAEHVQTKSSLIAEKDDLVAEKNKMQEKLEELEAEYSRIKLNQDAVVQKVDTLKKDFVKTKKMLTVDSQLEKLAGECDETNLGSETLNQQIDFLKKERNILIAEKDELMVESTKMKEQMELLEAGHVSVKIDQHNQQIDLLKKEKNILIAEKEDLFVENTKIQEMLKKFEAERVSVKIDQKVATPFGTEGGTERTLDEADTEEVANKQIEILNTERELLIAEKDELMAEKKRIQDNLALLQAERDQMMTEKSDLLVEKNKIQRTLELLETEHAQTKSSLLSEREAFAETVGALQRDEPDTAEIDRIKESLRGLQTEFNALKSENEILLNKKAEYEREKQQLMSRTAETEEKRGAAMEWYESLSKEYDIVSAQTSSVENELMKMKQENEKLKLSNYELECKVTESECKAVEVASELQCVQMEFTACSTKADQLASLVLERTKERDQALEHCEATVSVLESAEQAIQTLNTSIKDQESQESILWKDLKNAQAQNGLLDAKVKQLEAALAEAELERTHQRLKLEAATEKDAMSELSCTSKEREEVSSSAESLKELLDESQNVMKLLATYLDEAKLHKNTFEAGLKAVEHEECLSAKVSVIEECAITMEEGIDEVNKKIESVNCISDPAQEKVQRIEKVKGKVESVGCTLSPAKEELRQDDKVNGKNESVGCTFSPAKEELRQDEKSKENFDAVGCFLSPTREEIQQAEQAEEETDSNCCIPSPTKEEAQLEAQRTEKLGGKIGSVCYISNPIQEEVQEPEQAKEENDSAITSLRTNIKKQDEDRNFEEHNSVDVIIKKWNDRKNNTSKLNKKELVAILWHKYSIDRRMKINNITKSELVSMLDKEITKNPQKMQQAALLRGT